MKCVARLLRACKRKICVILAQFGGNVTDKNPISLRVCSHKKKHKCKMGFRMN